MTQSSDPYPAIPPLPPLTPRPVWSVMIPTYNCAAIWRTRCAASSSRRRRRTRCRSRSSMMRSAADDPEAVVRQIGGGRVAFFRQPKNVGPQANFTDLHPTRARPLGAYPPWRRHGAPRVLRGAAATPPSASRRFMRHSAGSSTSTKTTNGLTCPTGSAIPPA